MSTLTVGSGQQYTTISAAIAAANDGDVVDVQAGTYTNDTATITKSITVQADGGPVVLDSPGIVDNDKGILVVGTAASSPDVTLKGLTFKDGNGWSGNIAGVRYQGGNLTLDSDTFENNQMGFLGASNVPGTGSVTVKNSAFINNANNDDLNHNFYANDIGTVVIDNSLFEGSQSGGENVKSRALSTTITNSRIIDTGGYNNYEVGIPNGGAVTLTGDVIEKGAGGTAQPLIAIGQEGMATTSNGGFNASGAIDISGNTLLNDTGAAMRPFIENFTSSTAQISDNSIYGESAGAVNVGGLNTMSNNTFLAASPALDTSPPSGNSAPASVPVVQVPVVSAPVDPTPAPVAGAPVAVAPVADPVPAPVAAPVAPAPMSVTAPADPAPVDTSASSAPAASTPDAAQEVAPPAVVSAPAETADSPAPVVASSDPAPVVAPVLAPATPVASEPTNSAPAVSNSGSGHNMFGGHQHGHGLQRLFKAFGKDLGLTGGNQGASAFSHVHGKLEASYSLYADLIKANSGAVPAHHHFSASW